MVKGKNVQAIMSAIIVLVLLYAGQTTAKSSFGTCFYGCAVIKCLLVPKKVACVGKCFGQCLFPPHPLGLDDCRHNCAVDQCARLITDDFKLEDVEKVVECVDGCDGSANQCGALAQPIASRDVVSSPNKA